MLFPRITKVPKKEAKAPVPPRWGFLFVCQLIQVPQDSVWLMRR
jgi:hypothetical protein